MHSMKHLLAKIMTTMACAIIFLHAVVPHHHHDCGEESGLIFETEITCHCSHHHHSDDGNEHSDHPFGICHLADMLSHLVLNTKEDEQLFSLLVKAEAHDLLSVALPATGLTCCEPVCHRRLYYPVDRTPALPVSPLACGQGLRAPPAVA